MSIIHEVRLRGGFSDRMGISLENIEPQLKKLDDRTRTALINAINLLWSAASKTLEHNEQNTILTKILSNAYLQQVKYNCMYRDEDILLIVSKTIENDDYDAVLTIIEYFAQLLIEQKALEKSKEDIIDCLNSIFEKEFVGYRFVNERITPITDNIEVNEIEDAINTPYEQIKSHLRKSIELLSDRDNPDYENSIKESISAVECMCSTIIGKATTLKDALKKLESTGLNIHPSMKTAFEKLYGYTSDGTGIRHSGQLGGPKSTFEEAKFMLVSCCAFVNYLKGAISKYS